MLQKNILKKISILCYNCSNGIVRNNLFEDCHGIDPSCESNKKRFQVTFHCNIMLQIQQWYNQFIIFHFKISLQNCHGLNPYVIVMTLFLAALHPFTLVNTLS